MMIDDWCARHGVPHAARVELLYLLGIRGDAAPPVKVDGTYGSEGRQQSLTLLDAAQNGVWLTRNNVGVLLDKNGRPVRYGLCNESKAQNTEIKSADLIGIWPLLIEQKHVGQVVGQFISREVKHEGWQWSGDEHEVAQRNWLELVLSKGGDAAFCTGPGSFKR